MRKTKQRRVKYLKGEKMIYGLLIFLLILSPIMIVFSKATLSKTNITLKRMENKITEQKNENESLSMKIDELASLDKIQGLAKNLGLSYNNDNIKVIEENN